MLQGGVKFAKESKAVKGRRGRAVPSFGPPEREATDGDRKKLPSSPEEATARGWLFRLEDEEGVYFDKPLEKVPVTSTTITSSTTSTTEDLTTPIEPVVEPVLEAPKTSVDDSDSAGLRGRLVRLFGEDLVSKNFDTFKNIYDIFNERVSGISNELLRVDPFYVFEVVKLYLDSFWSNCKRVMSSAMETLKHAIERSIEIINDYLENMIEYIKNLTSEGADFVKNYLKNSFAWLSSWVSGGGGSCGDDCPVPNFRGGSMTIAGGGLFDIFSGWSDKKISKAVEKTETKEVSFIGRVLDFLRSMVRTLWEAARQAVSKLWTLIEYTVREPVTVNIIVTGLLWVTEDICENFALYMAETYNFNLRDQESCKSYLQTTMTKISSVFTMFGSNLSIGSAIMYGLSSIGNLLPMAGASVSVYLGSMAGVIFGAIGNVFEVIISKASDRLANQLDDVFKISSKVVLVRQNFEIMWTIFKLLISGCSATMPPNLIERTALVGENLLGLKIAEPAKLMRTRQCALGPTECMLNSLRSQLVFMEDKNKLCLENMNRVRNGEAATSTWLGYFSATTGFEAYTARPLSEDQMAKLSDLEKERRVISDSIAQLKAEIKSLVDQVVVEYKSQIESKEGLAGGILFTRTFTMWDSDTHKPGSGKLPDTASEARTQGYIEITTDEERAIGESRFYHPESRYGRSKAEAEAASKASAAAAAAAAGPGPIGLGAPTAAAAAAAAAEADTATISERDTRRTGTSEALSVTRSSTVGEEEETFDLPEPGTPEPVSLVPVVVDAYAQRHLGGDYSKILSNPSVFKYVARLEGLTTQEQLITLWNNLSKTIGLAPATETPRAVTEYLRDTTALETLKREAREGRVRPFTLQEHQRKVVSRAAARCAAQHGLLLVHSMGSGKTLSAFGISENLSKSLKVLVLTPVGLDTAFREDAAKIFMSKEYLEDKYKFENYDNLIKILSGSSYKELCDDLDSRVLICDEAHNLIKIIKNVQCMNPDARAAFLQALRKCPKVILLTGTPMLTGWGDMGILMNMVAGRQVFPGDDAGFVAKYSRRSNLNYAFGFLKILSGSIGFLATTPWFQTILSKFTLVPYVGGLGGSLASAFLWVTNLGVSVAYVLPLISLSLFGLASLSQIVGSWSPIPLSGFGSTSLSVVLKSTAYLSGILFKEGTAFHEFLELKSDDLDFTSRHVFESQLAALQVQTRCASLNFQFGLFWSLISAFYPNPTQGDLKTELLFNDAKNFVSFFDPQALEEELSAKLKTLKAASTSTFGSLVERGRSIFSLPARRSVEEGPVNPITETVEVRELKTKLLAFPTKDLKTKSISPTDFQLDKYVLHSYTRQMIDPEELELVNRIVEGDYTGSSFEKVDDPAVWNQKMRVIGNLSIDSTLFKPFFSGRRVFEVDGSTLTSRMYETVPSARSLILYKMDDKPRIIVDVEDDRPSTPTVEEYIDRATVLVDQFLEDAEKVARQVASRVQRIVELSGELRAGVRPSTAGTTGSAGGTGSTAAEAAAAAMATSVSEKQTRRRLLEIVQALRLQAAEKEETIRELEAELAKAKLQAASKVPLVAPDANPQTTNEEGQPLVDRRFKFRDAHVSPFVPIFDCPKFAYAINLIVEYRQKYRYIPTVYTNFDRYGFQQFAAYLTNLGLKYLMLHPDDTPEERQAIVKYANTPIPTWPVYEKVQDQEEMRSVYRQRRAGPCCLIIHPRITEGISLTFSPCIIVMEPVIGYGYQEQVYARVIRSTSAAQRGLMYESNPMDFKAKYIDADGRSINVSFTIKHFQSLDELAAKMTAKWQTFEGVTGFFKNLDGTMALHGVNNLATIVIDESSGLLVQLGLPLNQRDKLRFNGRSNYSFQEIFDASYTDDSGRLQRVTFPMGSSDFLNATSPDSMVRVLFAKLLTATRDNRIGTFKAVNTNGVTSFKFVGLPRPSGSGNYELTYGPLMTMGPRLGMDATSDIPSAKFAHSYYFEAQKGDPDDNSLAIDYDMFAFEKLTDDAAKDRALRSAPLRRRPIKDVYQLLTGFEDAGLPIRNEIARDLMGNFYFGFNPLSIVNRGQISLTIGTVLRKSLKLGTWLGTGILQVFLNRLTKYFITKTLKAGEEPKLEYEIQNEKGEKIKLNLLKFNFSTYSPIESQLKATRTLVNSGWLASKTVSFIIAQKYMSQWWENLQDKQKSMANDFFSYMSDPGNIVNFGISGPFPDPIVFYENNQQSKLMNQLKKSFSTLDDSKIACSVPTKAELEADQTTPIFDVSGTKVTLEKTPQRDDACEPYTSFLEGDYIDRMGPVVDSKIGAAGASESMKKKCYDFLASMKKAKPTGLTHAEHDKLETENQQHLKDYYNSQYRSALIYANLLSTEGTYTDPDAAEKATQIKEFAREAIKSLETNGLKSQEHEEARGILQEIMGDTFGALKVYRTGEETIPLEEETRNLFDKYLSGDITGEGLRRQIEKLDTKVFKKTFEEEEEDEFEEIDYGLPSPFLAFSAFSLGTPMDFGGGNAAQRPPFRSSSASASVISDD